MSKGVIVQLDHDTAHVLKNDGSFASYPRDISWQIGDVITLRPSRFLSLKGAIISCAAAFILIVGLSFAVYQIPTTYVELSVNPYMKITSNRFDRVLNVEGLNAEGEKLIQDMPYKNFTFTEVYRRLLNRLDNNGYLKDATMQFVVANDSHVKIAKIEQNLREVFDQYGRDRTLQVSIKRFEKNEYLALAHPIPIMAIPVEPPVNQPGEAQTEVPPNMDLSSYVNEQPLPSNESSITPSNDMPTPKGVEPLQQQQRAKSQISNPGQNFPNSKSWGGSRHGGWRNGWWDWD